MSDDSDKEPVSRSWFSLASAKSALETAGALAGASAVFAALAFGIGYVAIRQHDSTLGIISTTSYAQYVRTGIEFVPRSFAAIGVYLSHALPLVIGLLVLVGIAVLYAYRASGAREQGPWLERQQNRWIRRLFQGGHARMSGGLPLLVVVATWLVLGVINYFPTHLAPLRSINTGLLLKEWRAPEPATADEAQRVYELLHLNTTDAVPGRLLAPSRAVDASAEEVLLARYGRACIIVLIFTYLAFLCSRWRRRIDQEDQQREIAQLPPVTALRAFHRFALQPVLYTIAIVLILSLPALYGTLAITNALPCVTVTTDSTVSRLYPGDVVRPLTDLSADAKEVVLFSWGQQDDEQYVIERVKTANILRIIGRECPSTLLAEKRQHWELLREELLAQQRAKARRRADSLAIRIQATLDPPRRQ